MIEFAIITSIAAFLAGMGIGGGALFVILLTTFLNFDQKLAQALNLIMFMSAGISSVFFNIKNKKIDKKIVEKILPFIIVGSIAGTFIFYRVNSENLKTYFSIFMALIGVYEIITSVINIKKAKTNSKK